MTRLLIASSCLTLAVLVAPAAAQPAAALQETTDSRWAPFLGCWRAAEDLAATGTRVCVAPAGDGVTVTTVVGGQRVAEDTRIADGIARPVDSDGCRGTASARWSDNGFRLYRSAAVACDGGAPRTLATAAFFVPGPVWVDVETVEAAGTTSVRVSRLVPAAPPTLRDGSSVAAASGRRRPTPEATAGLTVPDVIELSGALPADGVQAALTEAPSRYRLNARTLIAMADAGVGERVIDLMVGLTYPARFDIRRASPGGWGGGGFSPMADPFFAPLVGPAALFDCYSSFGWAAASYWGNCAGYGALGYAMYPGYYSGFWGPYGGAWVVTQPGGPGEPLDPPVEGRLVNGRGYTQVRPVETSGSGNGGRNRGTSSGQTASGGSGGPSGGSGVSGSGYSGGGGGQSGGADGGRTAVPRGPGGSR